MISLSLAFAAACGDDDSSSPTPSTSAGASGGVSVGPSIGASVGVSAGASQSTGASGSPQAGSGTITATPGPSPVECTNAPPDAGLISQEDFGGDNNTYEPGEQIDITLILANCADNNAVLYYPTSQRYNFIVTDGSSVEIWRSSEGKTFQPVEGSDVLEPNDRLTYEDTWDQKDKSGNQVLEGRYKISAFSVGCSIAPRADCQFGPIGFVEIQVATTTPTPGA